MLAAHLAIAKDKHYIGDNSENIFENSDTAFPTAIATASFVFFIEISTILKCESRPFYFTERIANSFIRCIR